MRIGTVCAVGLEDGSVVIVVVPLVWCRIWIEGIVALRMGGVWLIVVSIVVFFGVQSIVCAGRDIWLPRLPLLILLILTV